MAIATVTAFGLNAVAGSSSNTIEITPIVPEPEFQGSGAGGLPGIPLSISDVGVKFKSVDDDHIQGLVISRIDMARALTQGNLVMDMIWINSNEVGGVLKKPDEFLKVGLYFLDSDQREADDDLERYSGDCDEDTQREFKEDQVRKWVCPDSSALSTATLTEASAFGILGSRIDGHSPLYVLAHIPKVDIDEDEDDQGKKNKKNDDDDGEDGSHNSGQIKQMEFVYTVLSAA